MALCLQPSCCISLVSCGLLLQHGQEEMTESTLHTGPVQYQNTYCSTRVYSQVFLLQLLLYLLGKKSVSKTTQQKLDVRLSSLHKSLSPCERRAWCRKLQYVTSPNSLPYATGDRKRPALEGNVLGLSSL